MLSLSFLILRLLMEARYFSFFLFFRIYRSVRGGLVGFLHFPRSFFYFFVIDRVIKLFPTGVVGLVFFIILTYKGFSFAGLTGRRRVIELPPDVAVGW